MIWMTFVGHWPPLGNFDLSSSSNDVLRKRAIFVGDRGATANIKQIVKLSEAAARRCEATKTTRKVKLRGGATAGVFNLSKILRNVHQDANFLPDKCVLWSAKIREL